MGNLDPCKPRAEAWGYALSPHPRRARIVGAHPRQNA